jgi:glycerol-3-phosphate acyltransferase PlsY
MLIPSRSVDYDFVHGGIYIKVVTGKYYESLDIFRVPQCIFNSSKNEILMEIALIVFTLIASYLAGCVCFGYYLVRYRTGKDVREYGSGNPGARNVGRLLGPGGFFLTLLGDAGKGAAAVWLALFLGLSAGWVMIAIVAVIAGHLWPLQMQFRGGKGFATAIGAFLVFDYQLAFMVAGVAVIAMVILRHTTLGGLAAMVLAPIVIYLTGYPTEVILGATAISALVLFGHRHNLREAFGGEPVMKETDKPSAQNSKNEVDE